MNVHEAKTHLSRLLLKMQSGEYAVIARGGKPVARLVPYEKPKKRWLGKDEGKPFYISEDFDAEVDPEMWGLDKIPD